MTNKERVLNNLRGWYDDLEHYYLSDIGQPHTPEDIADQIDVVYGQQITYLSAHHAACESGLGAVKMCLKDGDIETALMWIEITCKQIDEAEKKWKPIEAPKE